MSFWKDNSLWIFFAIVGAIVATDSLLTKTGNVNPTLPSVEIPRFYVPPKKPTEISSVKSNEQVIGPLFLKEGRPLRYDAGKHLFPLKTVPTLKDSFDTVNYSGPENFKRIPHVVNDAYLF